MFFHHPPLFHHVVILNMYNFQFITDFYFFSQDLLVENKIWQVGSIDFTTNDADGIYRFFSYISLTQSGTIASYLSLKDLSVGGFHKYSQIFYINKSTSAGL